MRALVRSSFAATVLALGLAGAAQAQNYSFGCVSNNNAADCATGAAQFGLALTQGAGYVDFLFTNTGPKAASITDIYFDWLNDAAAFSAGTITNGAGVKFNWGASPANLPSGNEATPDFQANLGADSDSPTQPNGVNPGEWVSFRFQTGSTSTANDLFSGALRVGVHAQGFSSGGSEAFITVASAAPEPEAYAMMLLGLAGVGAMVRRKRRPA